MEEERRRVFPRSERGDLPGNIDEIFGEDDPRRELHFVCEALFQEHDRISTPMMARVLCYQPDTDSLFWLCSDAAGYMDMVLEFVDDQTGERNDLPLQLLKDYLEKKDDPTHKVINPETGLEIEDVDHQINVWFEKSKHCKRRDAAYFAWKEKLVTDPQIMGGATVFPGTRLTVTHIGKIVYRGEWHSVILKDYPYLTEDDLVHASRFLHDESDLL